MVRHEITLVLHKQGAGYDLLGDAQLRVDEWFNESIQHLSDKTESSTRAPFGRIEVGVIEFPRLDVMLSSLHQWLEERLVHLLD